MSKLIVLRGNSGSGKTTTAKAVQDYFPRGKVMKISQDEIRLDILNVKDRKENPTTDLIQLIAEFGHDKFDIVIIEGILGSHIYREMFEKLYHIFDNKVHTYCYDVPFEVTLLRHSQREKAKEFGADRMKQWWLEKDVLNFPNETLITAEMSQEQVVNMIISDINK
ncbi:uridine kinase [Enterococcus sp. PF1-24]|uniref:zeta toxin family protein n=1 Tax=unclassified Enterococcus TaxID=2608891 RepID=UPI0024737F0B|nr:MULTISPECIES: zeta toxin family protein [unclassified Enterococcus]MDH6364675.1 uridine kinase [Enterococcus sp. PFB1-1]MDH6401776.1 uridine kinase [Enterococcus sp. PF1-24]